MNTLNSEDYVMNTQTGKAYVITTDTVQSRGRRQLCGTGIRNPEMTRAVENHLESLSNAAALVCFHAERILRCKHKQSAHDKQILAMYRALKNTVIA